MVGIQGQGEAVDRGGGRERAGGNECSEAMAPCNN